jgi:hypothetical protein
VSTQLRLVDEPLRERKARTRSAAPARRAVKVTAATRRAANWGQWQLDEHTRRVGRAGVAAARAALEHARQAEELRQAS